MSSESLTQQQVVVVGVVSACVLLLVLVLVIIIFVLVSKRPRQTVRYIDVSSHSSVPLASVEEGGPVVQRLASVTNTMRVGHLVSGTLFPLSMWHLFQ